MRLAIADPPYYGRAERWYGTSDMGADRAKRRPDNHPDAHIWDTDEAHVHLIQKLSAEYDGWVIAASSDPESMALYSRWLPSTVRTLVWFRRNAVPSGARVTASWEPVYAFIPPARRGRAEGFSTTDVLDAPAPRIGFAGSKPEAWTRWVLTVMGYDPRNDTVDDLFNGSGAVAAAKEGMLI